MTVYHVVKNTRGRRVEEECGSTATHPLRMVFMDFTTYMHVDIAEQSVPIGRHRRTTVLSLFGWRLKPGALKNGAYVIESGSVIDPMQIVLPRRGSRAEVRLQYGNRHERVAIFSRERPIRSR